MLENIVQGDHQNHTMDERSEHSLNSHMESRYDWCFDLIMNFIKFNNFQGIVYAVDESTLFIKGFAYDGNAPDAFFWVGNSARPSPEGYIIPYPEEYSGR